MVFWTVSPVDQGATMSVDFDRPHKLAPPSWAPHTSGLPRLTGSQPVSERSPSRCFTRNPERGEMTCLLKLEPGAYIPFHKHPEIEQTLVLQGSVQDHEGIAMAGDYIWRH